MEADSHAPTQGGSTTVLEIDQADIELLPSEYLKRVFFDSLTNSEIALRMVIDVAGIERVLLGTDFPGDMGPSNPVAWIQGCSNLSAAEKQSILTGNATEMIAL